MQIEPPARGGSARIGVGGNELVFEAVRGGYVLLWHAGRQARRYVVGLPDTGGLSLVLRPPPYPIKLLIRETIAIAPGARVRGFVQLPLVPTLLWSGPSVVTCTGTGTAPDCAGRSTVPADAEQVLFEFTPAGLTAEWTESDAMTSCCESSWFVRFPVHGGEARVTVPLRLMNRSGQVLSPAHVPMSMQASDLLELRSGIVTAPHRLTWNGREWLRTPAASAEVSA
ncbi:MAG: hypothetical protein KDC98_16025 [Planctomycetes bacterium]|nr:hypothetical protein [Planctomycetota bacterium]